MVENCTQVEVRYYLQYQPDKIAEYWFSYKEFRGGFGTIEKAQDALKKVMALNTLPDLRVRIIKQTKTIESKIMTKIEVLNDQFI